MIWILGGTSETGELLEKIRGRVQYIVTVATESGKEMLPDGENVVAARMDVEKMRNFVCEHTIDTVADVTHPYATEVSQNACQVCQEYNIRYLRFVRRKSVSVKEALYVSSVAECAAFLHTVQGCVFFTTGSKNIVDFQKVAGQNRFVYRVLSTSASLEECQKNHVAMQNIVAMLGPFSEELNIAMFRDYQADYVVMKDSGKTGGTLEKLNACLKLGITPIIISRKAEEGISDLDVLAEIINCT